MNSDEITSKGYLEELYRVTGGSQDSQASMYDIGATMGLEKAEAGRIAEDLMVQGFVELKTLAGGIAITDGGLDFLGVAVPTSGAPDETEQLSAEKVATEGDRAIVEKLCTMIKREIHGKDIDYNTLEATVFDLKSIDLQLLSPHPKNVVLKELLRSIRDNVSEKETETICAAIETVL